MYNKAILLALASDLKRVTLGLERGADGMVKRFSEEALKRKKEVDLGRVDAYIATLLGKLAYVLGQSDPVKKAEDALMYSTLFQNYGLKK